MSKNLLDLSGKIDALTIAIFDAIVTVTRANDIGFFLVGATARDLILHHGYGIAVRRATEDIDLGVQVSDWAEFGRLKEELLQISGFESAKESQRLLFQNRIPVDIVPFGDIQGQENEIHWPPDQSIRMRVIGFEDAYQNAQWVRLRSDPTLDVLVATPAGLATLKLIAWNDGTDRGKDALDLAYLLRGYMDAADNQKRLLGEHDDLLNAGEFDYERAGARLLGRDMAKLAAQETKQALMDILAHETGAGDDSRLVVAMTGGVYSESFDENLRLLQALEQGLAETNGS
jgi:predicted nucleotidyltransferase